jgi:pyruvate/2-oxoglutarate dehydrogenase complex dihydrolipoamide acyltransferase (E2) component
LTLNISS